jgi:hypothetical protein
MSSSLQLAFHGQTNRGHHDTQPNDTQNSRQNCDTQKNIIITNKLNVDILGVIMLRVTAPNQATPLLPFSRKVI